MSILPVSPTVLPICQYHQQFFKCGPWTGNISHLETWTFKFPGAPSLLNEDLPSYLCLGYGPLGDSDTPWRWRATGLACSGGAWREDQHRYLVWEPLETRTGAAIEELERLSVFFPTLPINYSVP